MPLKTQHDELPTLNLTPMIDVVFLLIIFFMVATQFTELERSIELAVPKVPEPGAMTAPPEKRIVHVFRDGAIHLDKEEVSIDLMTEKLAQARLQNALLGVVIRGDAGCTFQRVAEVLNACRKANIHELDIAVRPADRGTAARE